MDTITPYAKTKMVKELNIRAKTIKLSEVTLGKNLQPRLQYLARISFKIYGEIKSFSDKQKLRKFSTTKPTTNVKGTYIIKKYKIRKNIYKINPKQLIK